MAHLMDGGTLVSFLALTFLEIVLGVDNIIFLALAVGRLSPEQQGRGRRIGLTLAMFLRILMLVGLVWITRLDVALFTLFAHAFTIKDIVLIAGGLFLLVKGTNEIHDSIDGDPSAEGAAKPVVAASFVAVIVQIGFINIIFSLDSVITAVGMTPNLPVMVAAVVASTAVMLFAAKRVGDFIERRPTTKMLALAFILLVGVALIADGFGFHLPRGYVYFAIAFSLFVEGLNGAYRRARRR